MTLGYLTLDATPLETVDAAIEAGFSSVGIRITGRRVADPYASVLGNKQMIREIRERIDGSGIRLANVSAYHFFPDVTRSDLERVVETTAELGSKVIVANSYIPEEDRFLELFAPYCQMAARHGIRIAIEFMKYSELKTIGDADRVVRKSGQTNAGFLIDPLHLERSGGTPAGLGTVDPERIVFVQLCDALVRSASPSIDELRIEARTGRLHPGEGDLPLSDFLKALPEGTEIELEVPRPENAHLPHRERAAIVKRHAEKFLDAQGIDWRS